MRELILPHHYLKYFLEKIKVIILCLVLKQWEGEVEILADKNYLDC